MSTEHHGDQQRSEKKNDRKNERNHVNLHTTQTQFNSKPPDSTYLIEKIKQLADIVRDGRCIRIATFQMLFINFANAFHALVDAFIIGVRARFWTAARLN